ncbi:MAG: transposase [Erysipelotrichaceae bacterium]|nr:transposase [Erysipelotrichaceae bacterium]
MYLLYKQIAQFYFKKAFICVDSFHVIKHLNESLQKLRIYPYHEILLYRFYRVLSTKTMEMSIVQSNY